VQYGRRSGSGGSSATTRVRTSGGCCRRPDRRCSSDPFCWNAKAVMVSIQRGHCSMTHVIVLNAKKKVFKLRFLSLYFLVNRTLGNVQEAAGRLVRRQLQEAEEEIQRRHRDLQDMEEQLQVLPHFFFYLGRGWYLNCFVVALMLFFRRTILDDAFLLQFQNPCIQNRHPAIIVPNQAI
jgi:hypothetical protein